MDGSVLAGPTGAAPVTGLMILIAAADAATADVAVPIDLGDRHRVVADVVYPQGAVRLSEPGLHDGVHRSLLLRVEDDAPPALVARFEVQLAAMGEYIDAIRNSSLSRVAGDRLHHGWTHVWEQEFDSLDGLRGPYMLHPYHWAVVDLWFDDESEHQIVDRTLLHSFCALPQSVLRLAARTDEDSADRG